MQAIPTEAFWMVVGIGQGAPTRRHDTRLAAETEAKRLARSHQGIVFVVLESVSAVVKREFDSVTYRRDVGDETPF